MFSPWFGDLRQQIRRYISLNQRIEIDPPSKLQIGLWGLLLIVTLGLSLKDYGSFQLGTYTDDSSYAVLAKSLVLSDEYGLINVPGRALPTRYPFGFPLLLAPFAQLYPKTPDMLKIVSLVTTLLNASLLFWGWPFLSQSKSYWWGLAIAMLSTLSPQVIGQTRMVMSEPAFTTFALVALILAEQCVTGYKRPWLRSLLLGVVLAMALFIRTIGVALWIAIPSRLLMQSGGRALRHLSGIVIGVIGFTILVTVLTPVAPRDLLPTKYINQFEDPQSWGQDEVERALVPRLFSAVKVYAQKHLREAVIPIGSGSGEIAFGERFGVPDLPLVLGLMISGLILLGSLSFLIGKGLLPTVFLFEILYLGGLLLWPWRLARLLYPIQPFLFYQLLWGIKLITSQLDKIRIVFKNSLLFSDLGVILWVTVLLAISVYKNTLTEDSHQHVRDFGVGTTWLRENTDPDALIMAQQPQSIYLYSERKTIDYSPVTTSFELEQTIRTWGIKYILVAPKLEWRQDGSLRYDDYTAQILLPLLEDLVSNGRLKLVYQAEEDMVQIYQVLRTVSR
jgi:hypothetical protein